MDLNAITSYRRAASRADLALAPGEALLAGGTWLFSEPGTEVTGLVDLQTMGWSDLEETDGGLRIAATCTIARLVAHGEEHGIPLFGEAANALLASSKIWQTATVGGNIVRSYTAAAMTSMAVALDAEALVWTPGGGERRLPVADIPTGDGTNSLAPGEVLRAIDIPARTLRSRAVLRKEALADHGRSGAVVTGRVDGDGSAVFAITAATRTPHVRRFDALPDPGSLAQEIGDASGWYTDPLGSADWRRALSIVLAGRVLEELR